MDEQKEQADAVEKLHTAEIDVARTDEVIERFQATMAEQRTIFRRNGFGEAMTLIMRAPVRRGA